MDAGPIGDGATDKTTPTVPLFAATRFSQTAPQGGHKNSNVALRKHSLITGIWQAGRLAYFMLSFHSFYVFASLERKRRQILFIYTIFPLFWRSSFPLIWPETILTTVRTFTQTPGKEP
jgi:hypothetical protein